MTTAAAIIGPTASGKSALALEIADALNAEIISVDSGAVYRGMDIGTATPDAAARARVPHHLINITDPANPYNVGRFYRAAAAAAAEIRARGKTPLFVGGSMMYFNALLNGLTRQPPVPEMIEQQVRHLARRGATALYDTLRREDPAAAATIAQTDPQRLMRALCLHRSGGGDGGNHPPVPMTTLLLAPADRDLLRRRIADRLQQMWRDGLLEETRALLNSGLPPDATPLRMAGYRQATAHLTGQCNEAQMQKDAYHATSQLAKRQLTWMKKWHTAPTIDPFQKNITQTAINKLRGENYESAPSM